MDLFNRIVAGFCAKERATLYGYSAYLWRIMAHTGRGYRRHSMGRTGVADDRRPDRLGYTGETKLQHKARMRRIGVRHP